MRLYEVLNSAYYLGSHIELRPGKISRTDLHVDVHPRHHGVEVVLERVRPPECLSRSACVFLADSQHGVKLLGMPTDHVYAVEPQGTVERSDLNWWKMIVEAVKRPEPERAEGIEDWARQYWAGAECPAKQPIWEYRVATAVIV